MTKTIKRSLIVVLMLVFAVSAMFTATFTAKAQEANDTVSAEEFARIVAKWDGVDFDQEINILTKVGNQWLIDSAADAREMYAKAKDLIDTEPTYATAKANYEKVIKACKDALDFKAEINELVENLKVTSEVKIFGSQKLYVDDLEYKWNNKLDAAEKEYVASKFVNEPVEKIIDAVQERIAGIYARGAEAAAAIANIDTFIVDSKEVALLASAESLEVATAKLTAIYGVAIEEVFEMKVRTSGDDYFEDATYVALYVQNIKDYITLKGQYEAKVADAQAFVDKVDALAKKVDADKLDATITYAYLNNETAILDLEEEYNKLDASAENNVKAFVDAKVGDIYNSLLEGIYNDQIQGAVDMVLALPEADAAGIIPLKDALDAYRAKFDMLEQAQKDAVNATANAEFGTIKDMYEFYNRKSTEPWAMVQYAITAIDAIILDDGVFVMSVEAVKTLATAQKKYADVPESHKIYVTNRDVLFAAEAKMDADLDSVRVWAEMVVAIKDKAPISVINWMDVDDAYNYFVDDNNIIPQIQKYIEEEPDFREFILTDVEGVAVDQKIQYYYELFVAEIISVNLLIEKIDYIAWDMYCIDLETNVEYADIPAWLEYLTEVEEFYNEKTEFPEELWEDAIAEYGCENLPFIGIEYGQEEIDYIANEYGAIVKGWYDETEDDPTTDGFDEKEYYNYYNFYLNYTRALEVAKRYEVELVIKALTDAEEVTILDEEEIIAARVAFDALDAESEEFCACGQDAVRNADKLVACEEALKVITDKLDAFSAAVKALGDDATQLDLVAYQAAQDVRVTLTEDEAKNTTHGVAAAIVKLDALKAGAIKNINDLTNALNNVTGDMDEFKTLYKAYDNLHASQKAKANEAILAPDASIEALLKAYIYAGTVANTDWIANVEGMVNDLEAKLETLEGDTEELDAKIAEIKDAIATIKGDVADNAQAIEAIQQEIDGLENDIKALESAINKEISDREAADKVLQEQIDSTRTLAVVGLVIAIVALCAAAFVIVYKVILKK